MCKCRTHTEHSERSKYVKPTTGDDVVRRHRPSRVGLLYHQDTYSGGLPKAHVVYDDGLTESAPLYLFQSPDHASADPCWR